MITTFLPNVQSIYSTRYFINRIMMITFGVNNLQLSRKNSQTQFRKCVTVFFFQIYFFKFSLKKKKNLRSVPLIVLACIQRMCIRYSFYWKPIQWSSMATYEVLNKVERWNRSLWYETWSSEQMDMKELPIVTKATLNTMTIAIRISKCLDEKNKKLIENRLWNKGKFKIWAEFVCICFAVISLSQR